VHVPARRRALTSVDTTPLDDCVVRAAELRVIAPVGRGRDFADREPYWLDVSNRSEWRRHPNPKRDVKLAGAIGWHLIEEHILAVEFHCASAGGRVHLIQIPRENAGHRTMWHTRADGRDRPRHGGLCCNYVFARRCHGVPVDRIVLPVLRLSLAMQ